MLYALLISKALTALIINNKKWLKLRLRCRLRSFI